MIETQQLEVVEKKVGSLQLAAGEIRITSQPTYDRAVELLGTVKSMLAGPEVRELEEAKESAHQAHVKITGVWHRLVDPLKAMESMLKSKLLAFDRQKQAEEDAKRRKVEEERQAAIRAEQARLQAEAKAKADREAKEAAERARKAGESKRAQEQAAKQAAADAAARLATENAEKIATMEAAPIPEAKPSYERSTAVQARDNWAWLFDGTVFDPATKKTRIVAPETFAQAFLALVKHVAANPGDIWLLEPKRLADLHPALNNAAQSRKTFCAIPGGKATNRGSVAAKAS